MNGMVIDERDIIPINSATELEQAVAQGKKLFIRQDRVLKILSYNLSIAQGGTANVPSGYAIAVCAFYEGERAGTTGNLTIPVSIATSAANLVRYFYIASAYAPGTQIQATDGSCWTVTDTGYLNCFKSGATWATNTSAPFSDLGSNLVVIYTPE